MCIRDRIYFKTDDDDLFRDSVEYFPASGYDIEWITYEPVSYTHLDVYKRQSLQTLDCAASCLTPLRS